jgi:predicted nucleic acid-binding protein
MVLIDSSVWIETFRRKGNPVVAMAVQNLISEFDAVLCGPVKMEVLGGARPEEEARIDSLFKLIPYIPVTETLWEETADFYREIRQSGLTVPWLDAMIAGIAAKRGLRVYARDTHFKAMAARGYFELYVPDLEGGYNPPDR